MELVDIVAIIESDTPDWVDEAVKEHNRLNVHINGKHTAAYLDKIESIENEKQLKLRKDFLTTNRHVFVNLARPVDKVFSAKGGGNIFNLKTDDKQKALRLKLNNVRHGKSIRTWIKDIQANKYYTDPAGLVFFEWKDDNTHPTIKSINSIQNYKSDGRVPEWVLFNPFKVPDIDADFYRFVDKDKDWLIKKSGKTFTIIEDETFDNPFGKVPAIINSNIINSDLTHTESPFEIVISLADHYLRTGTIKNLVEFLHGFPIFWRYLADCIFCKGSGLVNGKSCSKCGGKGKNLSKDVTDIINVDPPQSDTDVKLAPDLAGYVDAPIAGWQEMRIEQESIFSLMELTVWGSKMAKDANNETATAAFINVQPVNDQLNNFTDAFEDMEKKMTDLIGTFIFGEYDGASINYGRRFLVEPPDVIWKKYETARKEGSPKITLDYLLTQFYQSEFANDLENLTIAQKSITLEPFIHKSDEDLMKLPVLAEDKKRKIYFNEWYKTVPQMELLSKDVEKLTKEYDDFLNKIEAPEEPFADETNTTIV